MFGDKVSQFLRINGDTMPLNGRAIGIVLRVLVDARPAVVVNPSGADGEKSDGGATLKLLLQRSLPRLPYQNSLTQHSTIEWENESLIVKLNFE